MSKVPTITSAPASNAEVLVYEFGARVDKECVEHINEQIFTARRMYNDLVACMRRAVDDMQAFIIDKAGAQAQTLQADIEALTEDFAAAKARDDEPSLKKIAQERREKWRELSAVLRETRKQYKSETKPFFDRIGKSKNCETYQIRCQYVADGLGWATANAQLDSAIQAFQKSIQRGRAPRFSVGADKTQDTLTLQFTQAGGVRAEDLLAGKSKDFAIEPTQGCGQRCYGNFHFRLGKAADKKLATGTWQYHRPIPAGTHIGLARLVRRRIGKDNRWYIQLMVKLPEPVRIETQQRKPLVTVHFGWAADVQGRRIGAIAEGADPSMAEIIRLPERDEADLERANDIQGERDNARDAIVEPIKALSLTDDEAADELLQKIKRLPAQHVSANRLHRLCRLLREIDQLPDWLENWRKKDRMRWQSHTHIARRARNHRQDYYRKLALDLARRYDTIALEEVDLAKAGQKLDEVTGEKSDFVKKARAGLRVAAIYELKSAIRWAATRAQAAVLDVRAETVSACAHCGGTVEQDAEDWHYLNCNDCGAVTDRKQNGAAVAYQMVAEQREQAVTDYWLAFEDAQRKRQEKQQEKKRRMAERRAEARAVVAQQA